MWYELKNNNNLIPCWSTQLLSIDKKCIIRINTKIFKWFVDSLRYAWLASKSWKSSCNQKDKNRIIFWMSWKFLNTWLFFPDILFSVAFWYIYIYSEIDSYRQPTHRCNGHTKYFFWSLLILKLKFRPYIPNWSR